MTPNLPRRARALLPAAALAAALAEAACSPSLDPGPDGGGPPPPSSLCSDAGPPRQIAIPCTDPAYDVGVAPVQTDLDGTVVELGTGPEGCLAAFQGLTPPIADADYHLLRVALPDGTERSFGLLMSGIDVAIPAGTAVHVAYDYQWGGFSPVLANLTVTGGAGLLLYVGESGQPGQLHPPAGVTAALGPQLCAGHDVCGPWARYTLDVTVPGAEASLQPGAAAAVGAYRIYVGDSVQQTAGTVTCEDWFVSATTIVIAP